MEKTPMPLSEAIAYASQARQQFFADMERTGQPIEVGLRDLEGKKLTEERVARIRLTLSIAFINALAERYTFV
jgi:hypothetical protein